MRDAEGLGLAASGLSSHDLVGRTLAELFSPEQVAAEAPRYSAAFAGTSVQFELVVAGHLYLIATGPLDVEDGVVQTIRSRGAVFGTGQLGSACDCGGGLVPSITRVHQSVVSATGPANDLRPNVCNRCRRLAQETALDS